MPQVYDDIDDDEDDDNFLSIDNVLDSPTATDRELLRAKLKRDAGRSDISSYDAIRARVQLELALGSLVTAENAQAVFVERLMRMKETTDHLPDLVMQEIADKGFDMRQKATIRQCALAAVRILWQRVADDGGPDALLTDLKAAKAQGKRRTSRAVGGTELRGSHQR